MNKLDNKRACGDGAIAWSLGEGDYVPRFATVEESRVLNVPEVVALEQALAASGTSLAVLMNRAGASIAQAVYDAVLPTGADGRPCRVVALCGTGNNGGDGWVAADLLASKGYEATIICPRSASELRAEPAHSEALRVQESGRAHVVVTADAQEVSEHLADADVVIDAVLGTGFSSGSIQGDAAMYVAALEGVRARCEQGELFAGQQSADACAQRAPLVVAADVPSGLSAQTGEAAAGVVRADVTVTMLVAKRGLLREHGSALSGKIVVADIA